MARARSARDADRVLQGGAGVFTPNRAGELLGSLGGTDQERVQMLYDAGLVLVVRGRECVVWQDVLDWLRAEGSRHKTAVQTAPRTRPAANLPEPEPLRRRPR